MSSPANSPQYGDEEADENTVSSLVSLCLSQASKLHLYGQNVAYLPRNLLQRVFRVFVEQEFLDESTIALFSQAECPHVQLSPYYAFQDVTDGVLNALSHLQGVRVLDLWNCRLHGQAVELAARHLSLTTLLLNRGKILGSSSSDGVEMPGSPPVSVFLSAIEPLRNITRLCLGQLEGLDLERLSTLKKLEELYLIECESITGAEFLKALPALSTLQFSDVSAYRGSRSCKGVLDHVLSLPGLSYLIITNVSLHDEHTETMVQMDSLRCLNVSFSRLSSSGLCLMLSHARYLRSCVCMGIKLPSEVTTSDLFGGAAPPEVRVISSRSNVAELCDQVYAHRRAAKTCESIIDLIIKKCEMRSCNVYQPTAEAVRNNSMPVSNYKSLLKMLMLNTGLKSVCTSALRILKPPEDASDDFLDKIGRKDFFEIVMRTIRLTDSTDVLDTSVAVLHSLFQCQTVVNRFLKCNGYVKPILTALEKYGSSNVTLASNICVILFLLGKPFDEPVMDEYIRQGAVRILVLMLEKLGMLNATVPKKICLALSVLANTSAEAKRFLDDGGLKTFSDLLDTDEPLACYMSSRGIGFLAREESLARPICEAGLISKIISQLRATGSPSQSDFACWALKALLEYKVARVEARKNPNFLNALLYLIEYGSGYCKDRCSEILLELVREEDAAISIGKKMINPLLILLQANEGSQELQQRILLCLSNLVKNCSKNQILLFGEGAEYLLQLASRVETVQEQSLLTLWSMCTNNKAVQASFRDRGGLEVLCRLMATFSCQRQNECARQLGDESSTQPDATSIVSIHVAQRVLDVLCNFLNSGTSKVAFLRIPSRCEPAVADVVTDLFHYRIPAEELKDLRGVPLLLSLMNDDDKDVRMFAIYALTLLAENETTQSFVVKCSLYVHLFRIWLTENAKGDGAPGEAASASDMVVDPTVSKLTSRAENMRRTDHEVGNVAYVVRHLLKDDPNFESTIEDVGFSRFVDTLARLCRSQRSLYAKRHSILTYTAMLTNSARLREAFAASSSAVTAVVDMLFNELESYENLASACSEMFCKTVKADPVGFSLAVRMTLVPAVAEKLSGRKDNLMMMRKIMGFVGKLVGNEAMGKVLADSDLYGICVAGFSVSSPSLSCLYLSGAQELTKRAEFREKMTAKCYLEPALRLVHASAKKFSNVKAAVVVYPGKMEGLETKEPAVMAAKLLETLLKKWPKAATMLCELDVVGLTLDSFPAVGESGDVEETHLSVPGYVCSPVALVSWKALGDLLGSVAKTCENLVEKRTFDDLLARLAYLKVDVCDEYDRSEVVREASAFHALAVLSGLLQHSSCGLDFLDSCTPNTMNAIFAHALASSASVTGSENCRTRAADRDFLTKMSRRCLEALCLTKCGRGVVVAASRRHICRMSDGIDRLIAVSVQFSDELKCAVGAGGVLAKAAVEALLGSGDRDRQETAVKLVESLILFADVGLDVIDEMREAWMKPVLFDGDYSVLAKDVVERVRVRLGLKLMEKRTGFTALDVVVALLDRREFDELPLAEQDAAKEAASSNENAERAEGDDSKPPWPWKMRSAVFQILALLLKKRKEEEKDGEQSVGEREKRKSEKGDAKKASPTSGDDVVQNVKPDIDYSPGQDGSSDWEDRQSEERNEVNGTCIGMVALECLPSPSKATSDLEASSSVGDGNNDVKTTLTTLGDDGSCDGGRALDSGRDADASSLLLDSDASSNCRDGVGKAESTDGMVVISKEDDDSVREDFKAATIRYFKGLFCDLESGLMDPSLNTLYVTNIVDAMCNQSSRADTLMRDALVDSGWLGAAREITRFYSERFSLLELQPESIIKKAKLKEERAAAAEAKETLLSDEVLTAVELEGGEGDGVQLKDEVDGSPSSNQLEEPGKAEEIAEGESQKKEEDVTEAENVTTKPEKLEEVSPEEKVKKEECSIQSVAEMHPLVKAANASTHTVMKGLAKIALALISPASSSAAGFEAEIAGETTSEIEDDSKAEDEEKEVDGDGEKAGSEGEVADSNEVPRDDTSDEQETVQPTADQVEFLPDGEVQLHRRILRHCLDSLVELAHVANLRQHFWSVSLPEQLQRLAACLVNCVRPAKSAALDEEEALSASLMEDEKKPATAKSTRRTYLVNISSIFWDLSAGGLKAGRELHQQEILPLLLDLVDVGDEYVQKAGAATLVNTSINSLKFGECCRRYPDFLERILSAWKRSVNADALNKKIAWTLNRIGWDYYPYCTYVALCGGLNTVIELTAMNQVIEDEMLADILDTTHMMLWIPHWSCQLTPETYALSSSITVRYFNRADVLGGDPARGVVRCTATAWAALGELQLKTVLRLLELVEEPLHVSARQSLLHILCLMGIREQAVAEVFAEHFRRHEIQHSLVDIIHAGFLKLVPYLMGLQADFGRPGFVNGNLMPFRRHLNRDTPIPSRVIRVLIVLTNHCAWMGEELVRSGVFELMTKHLNVISVDNVADYAQIVAMVLVQHEASLPIFTANVAIEFLEKLLSDEDVEKKCSAVKLLSAMSGRNDDALALMRDVGVSAMFEVISKDDDLRHKYLACNAVLSITDYGDYKLSDLVVPQAKILYDAGKAAQSTYTELFEGVMDVLQVLLHTLSGDAKRHVADLFPLEELANLFVETHIWTYYVFLSLLFSELATMGSRYRDQIRSNTRMLDKCVDLLRTTSNFYLRLHMTWLLSSLAFDRPDAATLIHGERGFLFMLYSLERIHDMDHYAVILYSVAHVSANDPSNQCAVALVERGGVTRIIDTMVNNPNVYLKLSAAFSLRRLWESCPDTRPAIRKFRDDNLAYVLGLKESVYRLYRLFAEAVIDG